MQSNGMGQQSVGLYLMAQHGMTPKLDYSIFSDPGKEKKETYEIYEWLKGLSNENSWTKIVLNDDKNLYKDILNQENSTGHRFASIPAFTKSGGMIRRQCTSEYKIEPVNRSIRKIQGLNPGQVFKPVNVWFGISLDEMDRMNAPRRKNVIHVYPFCGYYHDGKKLHKLDWGLEMTRSDISAWLGTNGYPIPPKSSCVFCPFQNNRNWRDLKNNHPEDWAAAVKADEAIRNMSQRGMNDKIYIHRSCTPLKDANLQEEQTELNFDCFGYCGV